MCKFQLIVVKKSPFIQYNTDNIDYNVNFTNYVFKIKLRHNKIDTKAI